jgi:serine/threonine protein phosphatase PrpC
LSGSIQGARSEQEDFNLALPEKGVFVVADGFGSSGAGARASRVACEAAANFLVRNSGDSDATLPFVMRRYFSLEANMVFNSLIHANRELTAANRDKSISRRGGASVLAALVERDFLAMAGAGVCSVRLFRGGEDPVLLNRPKTYMSLRGLYEDFEPEVLELHAEPGDWVLLHTDGLSRRQLETCVEARANWLSGGEQEVLLSRLKSTLSRSASEPAGKTQFADNTSFLLLFF